MGAPYEYTLSGAGIRISYNPVGEGAQPRLTYHDTKRGSRTFQGPDAIERVETMAGVMVSVLLDSVPDSESTFFSFLEPSVNLDASNAAPVHTEGVTTIRRTSLMGPPPTGQLQTYQVVALHGQADNVGIHPLDATAPRADGSGA